jgi:hypothetical protein
MFVSLCWGGHVLYCYAECYNSEFLLCRVSLLTSVVFFIVLHSVVMLSVVYAKYHVYIVMMSIVYVKCSILYCYTECRFC